MSRKLFWSSFQAPESMPLREESSGFARTPRRFEPTTCMSRSERKSETRFSAYRSYLFFLLVAAYHRFIFFGDDPRSQNRDRGPPRFRGSKGYQVRTLLPMLPKERMPSLPATLVTTVSISEPFPTTTKFVTTGGLPSVKSMVKVPVQSGFTVYVPWAGVCVKSETAVPAMVTVSICSKVPSPLKSAMATPTCRPVGPVTPATANLVP